MPRNIFFACVRKIHSRGAGISESPMNATENTLVLQIRFSTIELGHSSPKCQDIFFSHAHDKSRLLGCWHFRTAPKCDRKRAGVANLVPDHRIGAFPTTMASNKFYLLKRKKSDPKEPIFKNRPRTRQCGKFGSQPSNWGIPHHNAKKKIYSYASEKSLLPESRHFRTAL